MTENKVCMYTPMVTILCITYNQEDYIRQCLDGFIMQQTKFPFQAVVHDDASTDNTALIIKEYAEKYPHIIKPIFEIENQYSKQDGSIGKIMEAHVEGKYVAFCEGDDYWIDPFKLQKQVDYMESHPECSLVHSGFKYFYQESLLYKDCLNNYNDNLKRDEVLLQILNYNTYRIQTNTTLFRATDYKYVRNSDTFLYKSNYFLMGDTQLWIGLLTLGKVHYINECTAVYRFHANSVCRQTDIKKQLRFSLSCAELRIYLLNKLGLKCSNLYRRFLHEYIILLIKYLSLNYSFEAKFNPFYLYSCIKLLLYPNFVRKLVLRRMKYVG